MIKSTQLNALKSGEGQGAGAKENRGQEGTGVVRRKGGKRDLYDGRKQERTSKRQAFIIGYCLSSSQRNKPNNVSWLPFNVLRGLKQNFVCKKSQKTKMRTRDKKKQHYFSWNWKPFQVAYIIGHEWNGMTHVQACQLCQLCQCLLCLAKGQEWGEKGTKRYGKWEVVSTLSLPPLPLKTVATILFLNFIWVAFSPSKLETMLCSCDKKYLWN